MKSLILSAIALMAAASCMGVDETIKRDGADFHANGTLMGGDAIAYRSLKNEEMAIGNDRLMIEKGYYNPGSAYGGVAQAYLYPNGTPAPADASTTAPAATPAECAGKPDEVECLKRANARLAKEKAEAEASAEAAIESLPKKK